MLSSIGGLSLKNLKFEDIDGKKHVEREYTLYAQVSDFAFLDDAKSMEQHEQWKIVYPNGNISGRLRLINGRRYTEAVKQRMKGSTDWYECEIDITPDMFELKKHGAESGYLKERYVFPVEGGDLNWEVDVFKSKSGGRSDWVKVDLEFNSEHDEIPPLPFMVKDQNIYIMDDDTSDDIRAFVGRLWDEEWAQLHVAQATGGVVK